LYVTVCKEELADGFEAGDKVKIDLNLKGRSGQMPKAD
jgi:translation initiation factor IF-3